MAHSKTAFWMYNVETGEGKIFENESEFDANEWVDTPAKTKLAAIDVQEVDEQFVNEQLIVNPELEGTVADQLSETEPDNKEEEKTDANSTPDRDALKAEALVLGLEFPSNVKTDKLITMIAEAK